MVWGDLGSLPIYLLRHRRDPPLSLRDISPWRGESESGTSAVAGSGVLIRL